MNINDELNKLNTNQTTRIRRNLIGKPRERIDTMLVTNGKIHNELVEVLKGESIC